MPAALCRHLALRSCGSLWSRRCKPRLGTVVFWPPAQHGYMLLKGSPSERLHAVGRALSFLSHRRHPEHGSSQHGMVPGSNAATARELLHHLSLQPARDGYLAVPGGGAFHVSWEWSHVPHLRAPQCQLGEAHTHSLQCPPVLPKGPSP